MSWTKAARDAAAKARKHHVGMSKASMDKRIAATGGYHGTSTSLSKIEASHKINYKRAGLGKYVGGKVLFKQLRGRK